jgi:hypothetical protein
MIETFTPNDIIRYIYDDLQSDSEKGEIENALLSNIELSDFYFEMVNLKKGLNKMRKEPSAKTIAGILDFSKRFKPETVLPAK